MATTKIGLGLAALGRPEYINIDPQDQRNKSEEAFFEHTLKVLDEAYACGIRYFDTAASYGKGETFLLKWHESRKHPDVHFGTKWGYTYMANWKLGYKGKHEVKEHSLQKLQEQWSNSQKLLPALDIYQIHSATLGSGVLENIDVLSELSRIKRSSGVKIGLTTSGPMQNSVLEQALETVVEGVPLFDVFQVTFNILEQSTFKLLQQAKAEGKCILIKEGMANGRVFPNARFPHHQRTYSLIKKLAQQYKVGIDAIALRFCMDRVKPDYVLSGASTVQQLKENMVAESFELKTKELDMLSRLAITSKDYWQERSQLQWN